mmetsp:Transcript_59843/g.169562  ORF Transcript_59843/g.169562 Transcript_59843/m.169562 type:complete len:259 (-) Transcript_59843:139-915(-)
MRNAINIFAPLRLRKLRGDMHSRVLRPFAVASWSSILQSLLLQWNQVGLAYHSSSLWYKSTPYAQPSASLLGVDCTSQPVPPCRCRRCHGSFSAGVSLSPEASRLSTAQGCVLYSLSTQRHCFSPSCGRNGACQVVWKSVKRRCNSQTSTTTRPASAFGEPKLIEEIVRVDSSEGSACRKDAAVVEASSPRLSALGGPRPAPRLCKNSTNGSEFFFCVARDVDSMMDFTKVRFVKIRPKPLVTVAPFGDAKMVICSRM